MFEAYALPVLIITIVGLTCAVILAIAAKYMAVPQTEDFEEIRAALPGANCGACGFAGCDAYAKALAEDHTTPTNRCPVGGASVAVAISELLGVEAGEVVENAAFVGCSGTTECTKYIMDYKGVQTCEACNLFYQGRRACSHACLGYGDCVAACQFDAIHIIDGVAVVDRSRCTACGMCVKRCPNFLIKMEPKKAQVFVVCSSNEKGAHTRKNCTAGCIGCKKCEKTCKNGAITVTDNLASIDQSKCTSCGDCIEVCPVHVIKRFF